MIPLIKIAVWLTAICIMLIVRYVWKREQIQSCICIFDGIYYVYTENGGVYMQAQVKPWGNSQGIRISKDDLQKANIAIDDILDVQISDGMIILMKPFRHKTLEERAAEFGGQLDLDGEYDWGEQMGREVWE